MASVLLLADGGVLRAAAVGSGGRVTEEEQDAHRWASLATLLQAPLVTGTLYHMHVADGHMHVADGVYALYLRDHEGRNFFACTLVTPEHFATLPGGEILAQGRDLEVIRDGGIFGAVWAWIARCFLGLPAPTLTLT